MTTTHKQPSVQCFIDGASGQYIPKRFAREVKREALHGVKPEDLDYLARGPGGCLDDDDTLAEGETVRGEFYWDVWQDILDNATLTDSDGNEFKLYQDDSLFLVPLEWEWDDSTESFRPPESDTLRRYVLPAYWSSSIFNGDDSGLEEGEREQIDRFIEKEGLAGWTEADVGEPYFAHHNDANTGLAGDVAEYTFVKIG